MHEALRDIRPQEDRGDGFTKSREISGRDDEDVLDAPTLPCGEDREPELGRLMLAHPEDRGYLDSPRRA